MAEWKRVRVLVSGRVQGVWYRESARREAERLGVRGWVRNLEDGRVEALLEGPAGAVSSLVEWCRRGPPAAEVRELATSEEPALGDLAGFAVRRGGG